MYEENSKIVYSIKMEMKRNTYLQWNTYNLTQYDKCKNYLSIYIFLKTYFAFNFYPKQ